MYLDVNVLYLGGVSLCDNLCYLNLFEYLERKKKLLEIFQSILQKELLKEEVHINEINSLNS